MFKKVLKTAIIGGTGVVAIGALTAQSDRIASLERAVYQNPGEGSEANTNKTSEATESIQDLRKHLQEATSNINILAKSMYSDASEKLNEAKKQLDEAEKGSFWSDKNDELKQKYEESKEKFESVMNSISDAQYYSSQKFNDALKQLHFHAASTEDELVLTAEFYKQKAKEAEKEWNETKGSWIHWRKAEPEVVQNAAESRYEYFKNRSEDAANKLIKFLDNKKQHEQKTRDFKQGVSDTLDEIKARDVYFREKMIGSDAQQLKQKIQDDAEYGKHYVIGKKDYVDQKVYDAKEKVKTDSNELKNKLQDNAEYAANSMSGAKDYIDQKVYDAKDTAHAKLSSYKDQTEINLREIDEFYQNQTAEAKAEWDETKSSWLHWRKAKSDEIQHAAEAKYRHYQLKKEEANKKLNDYLTSLQNGIDTHTQYASEQLEVAKNYALGAKDLVSQAGYDAKSKYESDKAGLKQSMQEHAASVDKHIRDSPEYLSQAGYKAGTLLKDNYENFWNQFGVFQANSKETAQKAFDYYDEQFANAKKDYEDTQASLLHWRNAKSKELQNQARENFEIIKAKHDAVKQELERWKNSAAEK